MDLDAEFGGGDFGFTDESVRKGFIKKVYSLLTLQLAITFGIVCIFVFVPEVKEFALHNSALFWSAFGLTFVMIIVLGCCGDFRRRTPWNYIALFVFTLCEAYLLGCISASFAENEVLIAMGATMIVTVGLTLFAFQTKWDFTTKSGILFVCLLMLLVFGMFAGIFHSQVVNMVYSCLGALLFACYLVVDTQLILGGKHKVAISPEEYVFATLNLYLDVVNLFLYILAIVGGSNN